MTRRAAGRESAFLCGLLLIAVATASLPLGQATSFRGSDRPPQLVVGSGGVELADSPPVNASGVQIDGLEADVISTGQAVTRAGERIEAHGFVTVTRRGDGTWIGALVNPMEDVTIARCGSTSEFERQVCRLEKDVSPR